MPGEPAVERRSPTRWKVALRLLVSAVFLAVLIARGKDIGNSIPRDHALQTALLLSAAVLMMLLGIVLSAWRWQEVLLVFDARVSIRTLTGHHLAGQFVGNVLPSTIGGDVLRVARLSKTVNSTETAFASVVLERLSGMLALPLLVIVGFAFKPSLIHVDHAWFALLVAGLTLGVLGLILFAAGHPGLAGRFATNENWTRFIGAVFQGIDRGRRDPRRLAGVLAAALTYQVTIVATYLLIFHALDAHVPIAALFAFIPAVSMLQALPISFGGLGVREGALVLFRHGLGVTAGVATTAGLLWYGSLVIVSMLGAPIVAIGMKDQPRDSALDEAAAGRAG
jgi:uncharacterized membrane protein YbhN (UPF0104 family)